ncbi:MAG: 2-oxoacid:acceptor oxidoreductase family protein, partial [Thermodesulfobacteriota bacterium]|nr:2-oxoacid:acceptor oxidoreductase family protein [Thermodesulfobacteriota bacterium]
MNRYEVLLAGLGGGGVLLAGEFLARAATSQYEHVLWYPYYGAQQRGGPSQCFVIFSEQKIASPYVSRPHAVVVLEQSQFKPFEEWVRPGGIMITESLELSAEAERKDIRVLKIPAIQKAIESGDKRASNIILLG